ncbi:hypothetical protein M9H77_18492 [Catharanthus roseus]|uniref:Uncharacterized protein n=1 Tax=Catharanthus roseus TaxID=4058 RepID=A0ACC0B7K8_CATRO|nr:hypothetical protein M9H77_18492 [Catharanthus roseus]
MSFRIKEFSYFFSFTDIATLLSNLCRLIQTSPSTHRRASVTHHSTTDVLSDDDALPSLRLCWHLSAFKFSRLSNIKYVFKFYPSIYCLLFSGYLI